MHRLALVLGAAGVALLALNTFGLTQSLRLPILLAYDNGQIISSDVVPPNALDIGPGGSVGISLTREEALAEFERVKLIDDEEAQIRAVQALVSQSTIHYYPDTMTTSPTAAQKEAFSVPVWENWVIWSTEKMIGLALPSWYERFVPYEFLDGAKVWERGADMCGGLSSTVVYLLDELGIKSGKAGLDGHIVALAETQEGKRFVIDPDYGLTLEGSLSEVSVSPTSLSKIASTAGPHLAELYGPEGNIEFWDGNKGYRPMGYWYEVASYVLKWAVPVFFLIAALLFLRGRLSSALAPR